MYLAPCKGCTDRFVGCHSQCGKYAEFKEEVARITVERKKQKDKDQVYENGLWYSVMRYHKR